jgi:hypothetical protein
MHRLNPHTDFAMFAHRRNTQKPDEQLYAAFKQSFPSVGPVSAHPGTADDPVRRSSSLSEAIVDDSAESQRYVLIVLLYPNYLPSFTS